MSGDLYRLAAFTTTAEGGNPAGVWIGDELPPPAQMLRIAAEVGFSETAFVAPRHGMERVIRYYSPEAEVPFCGHATIAAGVQLGELTGEGEYRLEAVPGIVLLSVTAAGSLPSATLTSVEPAQRPVEEGSFRAFLETIGWDAGELDAAIPPVLAFAGAWHLVIAAATRDRLNRLEYDFARLKSLMLGHDLTTLQLIWRESASVIHARNPFPVGGVFEDPATGAAAAALGGYLRDAGLVQAPTTLLIRQGEAMGRPSRLVVHVPTRGGIRVTGHAARLPDTYPPLTGPTRMT